MKLKIEYMPVQDIKPYETNPRRNGDAVEDVARSIEEYGFRQPIVVDGDKVIVAGHTRYKAAQKLGLTEVPVVIADDLSEKQAAAYRLADNKTGQKATWDNKLLLDELDFIGDDFFTGFDMGGVFDILDENENDCIEENTAGVAYEIVFRSSDRAKIERIRDLWEDEQNLDL